jgi:hypothetical protein
VTPNPALSDMSYEVLAAQHHRGDDDAADHGPVARDIDDLHDGELDALRTEGPRVPGGVRPVVDAGELLGDAAFRAGVGAYVIGAAR